MKKIVIVGGGVAGHLIAHALQHEAEVILVDPRDHLEIPMAAPRLLVEPAGADAALVPYDAFLPDVRHVADRAVRIGEHRVELTSAEALEADFIVIATGRRYRSPLVKPSSGTRARRRAQLDDVAARLAESQRVLVVGGGPVGVEVAGELAEAKVRTVLAHEGDRLLPGVRSAAQHKARSWLGALGVEVLLNTRAPGSPSDTGPGTIGDRPYDLAIWCLGGGPCVEPLTPDLTDAVGPDGIRVLPSLQLLHHPSIFAVGDVTDLAEPKLGRWAAKHAAIAATNLRALCRDQPPIATYEATSNPTMVVTLGRGAAVGAIGPLPQWAVSALGVRMKGTDLLVGRYRRRVGLAPTPG